MSVRLAFTHIPRSQWAGGHNYLRNLLRALAKHQPGRFKPVVFVAPSESAADVGDLERIDAVEIVRSDAFEQRLRSQARAVLCGLDAHAVEAFRCQRIDVVVEIARFYGWRLPFPALAWFPDMQHRCIPQLFSRLSWLRREVGFRVQIASRRTIMLSSESTKCDCERFYPSVRNRTSVVRFATQPEPELLRADAEAIRRDYGLPDVYFYLPNQFWEHKNHQTVLAALSLLSERGVEVVIASTGSPADPRHPHHFQRIMREVEARRLTSNFRYLGMVPLSHVYALMRNCAGLINPSRFEGWSTTVEEAKSFGVPMILSDIKVHREQTPCGEARYFATDDATRLADHLQAMSSTGPTKPRDLIPNLEARVAMFAAEFSAAVERARDVRGRP